VRYIKTSSRTTFRTRNCHSTIWFRGRVVYYPSTLSWDYIELRVDETRLRNSCAVLFPEVPDDSCDAWSVDEDNNQRHLSEEFTCWSRNTFEYA